MIKIWKKVGQTPLELLKEIRLNNPSLKNEILSYAGRLDPMAEGEMLILVGEKENKEREKYLSFDKEYEAEILLGFSTDTYDLLGLITRQADFARLKKENINILEKKIKKILSDFLEKREQEYPVFSSKTVSGRPLFDWYKSGEINKIEIPLHEIKIKETRLLSISFISSEEFKNKVKNKISLIKGDFRQEEIFNKWNETINLPLFSDLKFPIVKIYFNVSSGTYIRGLAEEIGEKLKIPTFLFSLKRNKVFNLV